jgi:hypothetical protein
LRKGKEDKGIAGNWKEGSKRIRNRRELSWQ